MYNETYCNKYTTAWLAIYCVGSTFNIGGFPRWEWNYNKKKQILPTICLSTFSYILTHWPLGDVAVILINFNDNFYNWLSNFQTDVKHTHFERFLRNRPQVTATRPYWWLVNIISGNGFVPSGNKPSHEPMLIKFKVYIWHHQGPMS